MKTKEHKESNGCEKYYCWRYALCKINFWTILKKLLQKNDFRRFPLFEIFALLLFSHTNFYIAGWPWGLGRQLPNVTNNDKFLCLKYCKPSVFLTENFNRAVSYCYRNEVALLLAAISNSYKAGPEHISGKADSTASADVVFFVREQTCVSP